MRTILRDLPLSRQALTEFVLGEFDAPFSPMLVRILFGLSALAGLVLVIDGGAVL